MTRISRKIISCLLGAVALIAIAFGIVFMQFQTKTVSAATVSVKWQDSEIIVANDRNCQRLLVNTVGLHWMSYNNESYADE